mgnify:CR=1 FL=1
MKDLDEYTTRELIDEINRRALLRERGICDYCERKGDSPTCKFPERHQKAIEFYNRESSHAIF